MKFRQEYLSFDCAYKSLGVCHIVLEFDVDEITAQTDKIMLSDNQHADILILLQMLTDVIKVIDINTYDILPGNAKDTDMETKTIALKKFLGRYNTISPETIVLIENQPIKIGIIGRAQKSNTESPIVAHQLCYHFSPNSRMMSPSLKGKISFSNTLTLEHFMSQFAGRFKTESENKRKARKEHTKANLKWFLARFAPNVKLLESTMDDAADAFMQFAAHIKL